MMTEIVRAIRNWFLAPPTEPYGRVLATRVADLLDQGGRIADSHAYYCGTGLVLDDGLYCWAHIDDGYPGQHLQEFAERQAFIDWLAGASDASLERGPEGSGRVQIPGRKRMLEDTRG